MGVDGWVGGWVRVGWWVSGWGWVVDGWVDVYIFRVEPGISVSNICFPYDIIYYVECDVSACRNMQISVYCNPPQPPLLAVALTGWSPPGLTTCRVAV